MCSSIFFLFSVVVYFALVRYKNVISILLVSDELDFSLYFVSWFENRFIWSFFSLPLKNHLKRRNKIEQNERKNYAFLEIMMNKFHVIRFPAESFELFLSLQPLIKLTGETRKQPIESWIRWKYIRQTWSTIYTCLGQLKNMRLARSFAYFPFIRHTKWNRKVYSRICRQTQQAKRKECQNNDECILTPSLNQFENFR